MSERIEPSVYEFVFRGLLTEQALDVAGRADRRLDHILSEDLQRSLGIDYLPEELVASASRMAMVYTAMAAWENSVRKFVASTLLENAGSEWWASSIPDKIQKRAESRRDEEEKIRWHVRRGGSLIDYTELGDLDNIIKANWVWFEPFLRSQEWVSGILGPIERSRNVIMHSGELDPEDIERAGMGIRDWIRQVGA